MIEVKPLKAIEAAAELTESDTGGIGPSPARQNGAIGPELKNERELKNRPAWPKPFHRARALGERHW